jgi:hypothetical protein
MKRGEGGTSKVLILSAILIISISLVSASFLGDIFSRLFGTPTGTGYGVNSGEPGCYDSDGYGGFIFDGYVTVDGFRTDDKCNSNTAIDYYCSTPGGEAPPPDGEDPSTSTPLFILPFGRDAITGAATITPSSTTKDCSANGQECIGAGVCGCDVNKIYTCNVNDVAESQCGGHRECNGLYLSAQCIPNSAPPAEEIVCNDGKDDNCDGSVDVCASGKSCVGGRCQGSGTPTSCKDSDGDRYAEESDPTLCANLCSGQSCLGGSDCNDANATIKPGATESCTDGVDNDCDGLTDSADTANCAACTPKTQAVACTDEYEAGYQCGVADDGCGGTVGCGTCNTGFRCTFSTGECTASPICDDTDGDGYGEVASSLCAYSSVDCDDNDNTRKPGNDETCDAAGKDNDCNPSTLDSSIRSSVKCQPASSSSGGTCVDSVLSCTSGAVQTCESIGLKASSAEISDDDIDNNCDGTIDEGSECTTGGEKSCGAPCAPGTQSCTGGTWGTCELTSSPDLPDSCDNPVTGQPCSDVGRTELCGTDVGACMRGLIECLNTNVWGECDDVGPETEVCDDVWDNDCDTASDLDDLDCGGIRGVTGSGGGDSSSGTGDSAVDTSSVTTSGSQESGKTATTKELAEKEFGSLSFFQKLFRIIQSVFNVGRSIVGLSIDTPEEIRCSDSDGGKDYFQKGTGNGLNLQDNQIWFVDFCYKDTTANQVEKCGGDNCYLTEYICDGSYMQIEKQITCKFGCANGACIPDASLGEDCRYFDRDRWEWVNRC